VTFTETIKTEQQLIGGQVLLLIQLTNVRWNFTDLIVLPREAVYEQDRITYAFGRTYLCR
jgi:hypothetical protein